METRKEAGIFVFKIPFKSDNSIKIHEIYIFASNLFQAKKQAKSIACRKIKDDEIEFFKLKNYIKKFKFKSCVIKNSIKTI